MVRHVTPAEFQRLMREEARKRQQAIEKYNRDVAARNQKIQRHNEDTARAINNYNRAIDNRNREIQRNQQHAIDTLNRAVRAHNAQVQANLQRRQSALRQLSSQTVTSRYSALHTSTIALGDAYDRLERRVAEESSDANDEMMLALPGRENINSLVVMNSVLGSEVVPAEIDPQQVEIENELRQISSDLDKRWKGAVFALNPNNPDAARHFCTSAREILVEILDLKAPDADVATAIPNHDRAHDGRPTRRTKIQFILHRGGIRLDELRDFVDADIENVVQLFQVFNSATHGEAGKYGLPQLVAIKQRVEGGILYLSKLIQQAIK